LAYMIMRAKHAHRNTAAHKYTVRYRIVVIRVALYLNSRD
jgi:hypothetical protein